MFQKPFLGDDHHPMPVHPYGPHFGPGPTRLSFHGASSLANTRFNREKPASMSVHAVPICLPAFFVASSRALSARWSQIGYVCLPISGCVSARVSVCPCLCLCANVVVSIAFCVASFTTSSVFENQSNTTDPMLCMNTTHG